MITNIGMSSRIPNSIVTLSATQPIIGRIARPGITHNDPIAKPVARARGGIANDRAANTPGPMMASDAEMRQFNATATQIDGANANPADATDVTSAMLATNRIRPFTLPM